LPPPEQNRNDAILLHDMRPCRGLIGQFIAALSFVGKAIGTDLINMIPYV
jgi:hypothetical protein